MCIIVGTARADPNSKRERERGEEMKERDRIEEIRRWRGMGACVHECFLFLVLITRSEGMYTWCRLRFGDRCVGCGSSNGAARCIYAKGGTPFCSGNPIH